MMGTPYLRCPPPTRADTRPILNRCRLYSYDVLHMRVPFHQQSYLPSATSPRPVAPPPPSTAYRICSSSRRGLMAHVSFRKFIMAFSSCVALQAWFCRCAVRTVKYHFLIPRRSRPIRHRLPVSSSESVAGRCTHQGHHQARRRTSSAFPHAVPLGNLCDPVAAFWSDRGLQVSPIGSLKIGAALFYPVSSDNVPGSWRKLQNNVHI